MSDKASETGTVESAPLRPWFFNAERARQAAARSAAVRGAKTLTARSSLGRLADLAMEDLLAAEAGLAGPFLHALPVPLVVPPGGQTSALSVAVGSR